MLNIDDPFLRRGKMLGSVGEFLETVRLLNIDRKTLRKRQ